MRYRPGGIRSVRYGGLLTCPCDGCGFRDPCRTENLACQGFLNYVAGSNKARPTEPRSKGFLLRANKIEPRVSQPAH